MRFQLILSAFFALDLALAVALECNDCSCHCASGSITKVSNPSINGCGGRSFSSVFGNALLPDFIECCNQHDTCYGTCGESKASCDDTFCDCVWDECSWWNVYCFGKAYSVCWGVESNGCSWYTDAQKNRCTCA